MTNEERDRERRWRKTLQVYGLRLMEPHKRIRYLESATVEIYQTYRLLLARDGKPPSAASIASFAGDVVSRQAVHYHLKKLRIAGLIDEKDERLPDQHDVTYLFGAAICLLGQWLESFPNAEPALETAQLLRSLKLADVVDRIEKDGVDMPETPEWFK